MCSMADCGEKVYAKSLCRRHYRHIVEGGHEPYPYTNRCVQCNQELVPKATKPGTRRLCLSCYQTQWRCNNKDSLDLYQTQYRVANKGKIQTQVKQWRKEHRIEENRYYAHKRKDPLYRLAHNMRSRLYEAISGKIKKPDSTELLTGCSFKELMAHLESQFKEGMTVENYGTVWSVDHKIPLCVANNEEDIRKLCHYSNLKPLFKSDNSSKATKDKKLRRGYVQND